MIIQEGLAKIFYEKSWLDKLSSKVGVFYNPYMRINRDFTLLILKATSVIHQKKLKILDSMAATGIRSIRILKEIPEVVDEIVINDINPKAIEFIERNLKLNNIEKDRIKITNKDARILMLEYQNYFNYIDIDPFGSPVGFIQPAVLSLKNKGILGITATDVAALSGARPKACVRKYSCWGYKTDFYLEFGLRVLAKYVIEEGLRFEMALIPVFGYYFRHHYRIFFIKSKKKKDINYLIDKIKFIRFCKNCLFKSLEDKVCPLCRRELDMLGPIFIGPIYDNKFIDVMSDLIKELDIWGETKKIFMQIKEGDYAKKELWYYYDIHQLAKVQKISRLPKISEILEKYGAVRSHFSHTAVKSEEYIDLRKFTR